MRFILRLLSVLSLLYIAVSYFRQAVLHAASSVGISARDHFSHLPVDTAARGGNVLLLRGTAVVQQPSMTATLTEAAATRAAATAKTTSSFVSARQATTRTATSVPTPPSAQAPTQNQAPTSRSRQGTTLWRQAFPILSASRGTLGR